MKRAIKVKDPIRWDEARMMKFAQLYKEHPNLWDDDSPDYRNLSKRNSSVKKIAAAMNLPNFGITQCRERIKILRSYYARELKSLLLSEKVGKEHKKPTYPWFDCVDRFLRRIVAPGLLLDSLDNQHTSVPAHMEFVEENTNELPHGNVMEESPDTCQPSSSSSDVISTSNSLTVLTSAVLALRDLAEKPGSGDAASSEFQVFGRSVAAQLYNMPLKDALQLQAEIQQLITERRIQINRHAKK